jgi:hypothetical protein
VAPKSLKYNSPSIRTPPQFLPQKRKMSNMLPLVGLQRFFVSLVQPFASNKDQVRFASAHESVTDGVNLIEIVARS